MGIGMQVAPRTYISDGDGSALVAFPCDPERFPVDFLPSRFNKFLFPQHPPQEQSNECAVAICRIPSVADQGNGLKHQLQFIRRQCKRSRRVVVLTSPEWA